MVTFGRAVGRAARGALGALLLAATPGCQWIGGIVAFDATEDAGTSLDGGSWCESQSPSPTLCADFDEPQSPSLPWTFTNISGGASAVVDDSTWSSPPGSLVVRVPDQADGSTAYAGLYATFNQAFTQARVEFEYLAAHDTDDNVVEFSWGPAANSTSYFVALALGDGNAASIAELVPMPGGAAYPRWPFTATSSGGWVKVSLQIRIGDGGLPYADVKVAGTSASHPLSAPPFAPPLTLRIGGVFVDMSPTGWTGNFDNIAVYLQ